MPSGSGSSESPALRRFAEGIDITVLSAARFCLKRGKEGLAAWTGTVEIMDGMRKIKKENLMACQRRGFTSDGMFEQRISRFEVCSEAASREPREETKRCRQPGPAWRQKLIIPLKNLRYPIFGLVLTSVKCTCYIRTSSE